MDNMFGLMVQFMRDGSKLCYSDGVLLLCEGTVWVLIYWDVVLVSEEVMEIFVLVLFIIDIGSCKKVPVYFLNAHFEHR